MILEQVSKSCISNTELLKIPRLQIHPVYWLLRKYRWIHMLKARTCLTLNKSYQLSQSSELAPSTVDSNIFEQSVRFRVLNKIYGCCYLRVQSFWFFTEIRYRGKGTQILYKIKLATNLKKHIKSRTNPILESSLSKFSN